MAIRVNILYFIGLVLCSARALFGHANATVSMPISSKFSTSVRPVQACSDTSLFSEGIERFGLPVAVEALRDADLFPSIHSLLLYLPPDPHIQPHISDHFLPGPRIPSLRHSDAPFRDFTRGPDVPESRLHVDCTNLGFLYES